MHNYSSTTRIRAQTDRSRPAPSLTIRYFAITKDRATAGLRETLPLPDQTSPNRTPPLLDGTGLDQNSTGRLPRQTVPDSAATLPDRTRLHPCTTGPHHAPTWLDNALRSARLNSATTDQNVAALCHNPTGLRYAATRPHIVGPCHNNTGPRYAVTGPDLTSPRRNATPACRTMPLRCSTPRHLARPLPRSTTPRHYRTLLHFAHAPRFYATRRLDSTLQCCAFAGQANTPRAAARSSRRSFLTRQRSSHFMRSSYISLPVSPDGSTMV